MTNIELCDSEADTITQITSAPAWHQLHHHDDVELEQVVIFVFSECSSSEQRCISEHEISSQQRCQAAQLYQHQTSSSSVSWSQSRVHGEVPGHVHPHRHGAAHPAQHEADCSGGDSVSSETRIISVSKHVPSLQSAVSVSWSILSISEWQLLTPVISSSQD